MFLCVESTPEKREQPMKTRSDAYGSSQSKIALPTSETNLESSQKEEMQSPKFGLTLS